MIKTINQQKSTIQKSYFSLNIMERDLLLAFIAICIILIYLVYNPNKTVVKNKPIESKNDDKPTENQSDNENQSDSENQSESENFKGNQSKSKSKSKTKSKSR